MATGNHATLSSHEAAIRIKAFAQQLGFDSCGVTDVTPPPHGADLWTWIEHGMAGDMDYMRRQLPKRLDPSRIVRGATRVIVVTRNYCNPDPEWRRGGGKVAKYARGRDYHEALSTPLDQLVDYVKSLGGPDVVARWYVDAGPVPERELGQRAGLGWIGKNTMLIDPRRGSFFFIASVFTDLDLAIDPPFESDRCGSCRRCLDACPTDAFPEPRVLDSRLCISYLTIEHRSDFDDTERRSLHEWVFGCDICQDVCPWNVKFATATADPVLNLQSELASLDVRQLADISDDDFDQRYGWTPLTRPGAAGMRRNARAVLESEVG